MPQYVEVTDTTSLTSINLAIANLSGGGTIRFKAGTYNLAGAIVMKSDVRVIGDGMIATVFKFTGSATPFDLTDLDNVAIENVGFDGGGGSYSYIIRGTVTTGNHGNILVKNCRFSNFKTSSKYCVDFRDMNDCRVEGCQFDGVWSGVSFRAAGKDIYRNSCANCEFKDFEYAGVYATLISPYCTYGTSVIGCRASKATVVVSGGLANPILFNGPRTSPISSWHMDAIVSNNVIIGPGNANSGTSPIATSDQFFLSNIKGGVVAANVSANGGENGFLLWACEKVVVCGNQTDMNWSNGILLKGCSNCNLSGNVSTNNGRTTGTPFAGIAVTADTASTNQISSSNNLIVGNLCTDDQTTKTQDYGIWVYQTNATGPMNVNTTTVGCNRVTGNALTGIYADSEYYEGDVNDTVVNGIYGTLAMDPQYKVVDVEVTVNVSGAADVPLNITIPERAVVRSAQTIVRKAFTTTTSIYGIGPSTSDPIAYGKSDGVGLNKKSTQRLSRLIGTGGESLKLYSVNASGAYSGTISGTNGSIRVKIIYEIPVEPLISYY
ncbi:MAG: NosD domain-containing protein [Fimbriimonadaceae bacterium]